ncbi:MAG: GyrI-like domain-containing protein [Firmicutes bacterium]|nr:GyrI-like domain-containing protein [Bacillota bacterium]
MYHYQNIYDEWFPSSGYEHTDAPEFEMYYQIGKNQYMVEVWIPVIKK